MTSKLFLGTVFTDLNKVENGDEQDINWVDISMREGIKGVAGQLEICPTTKRHHWQFLIRTTKSHRKTGMREVSGLPSAHFEPYVPNKDHPLLFYVHKDATAVEGTRFIYGQLEPEQGKRNDLNKVKDDIMKGKPLDDIILEKPELYHQYGRTLEKIKTIRLKRNKRINPSRGVWLWGRSGCGKSHKAYMEYAGDDYYTWVKGTEYQCGYEQQKVVVINEFRGELKLSSLLDLVDKWDYQVQRKQVEAIPFNTPLVVITSCSPPEEIYQHALSGTERLDQLTRRFEIMRWNDVSSCFEVVNYNTKKS